MHESNIRDGGKTVHVVHKYLFRSLKYERVGAGGVTPRPQFDPSSFKDDVTIILLLLCVPSQFELYLYPGAETQQLNSEEPNAPHLLSPKSGRQL
jgi:hypothetical protein